MPIINILASAMKTKVKEGTTEHEVGFELAIQTCLKYAPDRRGGGGRKKKNSLILTPHH